MYNYSQAYASPEMNTGGFYPTQNFSAGFSSKELFAADNQCKEEAVSTNASDTLFQGKALHQKHFWML